MTLTECCYMAQIRSCGSTSAAQALVGRSLAIGISQAMRDVSRVEVFSGSKFGAKNVIVGARGAKCGCLGTGELEAGERFAEVPVHVEISNGAYGTYHNKYQPATAFPLSKDLHHYSTSVSRSAAVPFSNACCQPSCRRLGRPPCHDSHNEHRLPRSCHNCVGSTIIHQSCCLISDVIP